MTIELPKQASDRYELLQPLGEGGVGTVHVALDRETGERVALKKLTRMTPLSVLRFKREFRALADIRHRNLVKLYELEHTDDGWFLTMELVEGSALLHGLDAWTETAAHVANDNAPESEQARIAKLSDAFSQLAQAVHAIHQAGMLHRDLKPSNVILEQSGRVVVLDFGLVRELGQSAELVTLQGTTTGTPGYMPPEQARGEELSEASDWYAFGVMLYEAMSGVLPIDGRSALELIHRKLQQDAPSLPRSAGPKALRQLCAQLLRRDAHERPGAQEILSVLAQRVELKTHAGEHTTSFTEYTSLTPDTQTSQASSELFGRDAERLQLEAALSSCIREHATVVVHVRGPSGSGKSALVQSFLTDGVPMALTATAEPLVLRSRCYEREAMPFKSIDGVVDALATHLMTLEDVRVAHLLPQDIAALTALFPVFERVPAIQQLMTRRAAKLNVDSLQLRRRAEEGFQSLLTRIAETRPLVIWIDDLQWGDLDSTQLLQDWLKRPSKAPLLIVLSYRSDDIATNPGLSSLLTSAARSEQLTEQCELELQPLKDADVHALCWKRLGLTTSDAPMVIARIVRSAQGNPFLATQLAALARAKLARGETDLSSLSMEDLVQHTSAMLSEPAQQLLRVLAVAGQPLAPRVALEASDVSRGRRAHIHELQTLRLVRTRYVAGATLLEVYHDGVRRSVQASLSDVERKRIHQALLNTLLREDSTDAGLLHELALGAGELGRARHYGVLAAEAASANLAFERAAELYERCVQLAASNAERAELLKQLAQAQVRCRRGGQAAAAYLQASELAPPAERVELMQLAASHLLRSGRFEEGERLVQQVLEALKIHIPESEAGLYAAIAWERVRIAVFERVIRPRADVTLPPEGLRIGMLYAMLALDTQCYTPLRATLFQLRATRMCFQHGESQTTARAYCLNAALSTLSADSAAAKRVDEMLARAEALIDRKTHPETLLELYSARAVCAMFLGRLAQVIEPARAAEEVHASNSGGGALGDYFYMFVVRTARVSALQFLGRHGEAEDVVRQLLEDAAATNNRCAALQATLVRTGIEQVLSCCRDSRARLDAERSELPTTTVSVLHMLHVLSVMRAACMTGEHDWALEIYADFKQKYESSPLKHSAYLVYLLRVNHARLVLNQHVAARAGSDPEPLIREHLQWLAKKAPVPFRKPAPLRLLARVAALRSEHAQAAELLEQSRRAHAEIGAIDEAERERYALGLITTGEIGAQLTAAAITSLRSMGVLDPEQELRGYYPELLHSA